MAADPITSLGAYLRSERERRGITIEQVASATKINIRVLHALEADHYGDLPAKPFIRGFVTSYARFIDLDASEILSQFDSFIDHKVHERPARDTGHSGYAFEKREGEQSRTVLWFVMGGFIVIGAVIILVLKPSFHHHKHSHIDKLKSLHEAGESSAVPLPDATFSPVPTATPSAAPSPALRLVTVALPPPHPAATVAGPILVLAPPPASVKPPVVPAPVVAVPTPVVTAKPLPVVTPSKPTPIPTSPPTATVAVPENTPRPEPSPMAAQETGKPDPLNSGRGLFPKDIKYKVTFRTSEDIWVRYQADSRPMMKIILRQGRVLVIQAKEVIRFQTSDASAVSFNLNRNGSLPLSGDSHFSMNRETATWIISANSASKSKDLFPGEGPLGAPPAPFSRESSEPQTPAE